MLYVTSNALTTEMAHYINHNIFFYINVILFFLEFSAHLKKMNDIMPQPQSITLQKSPACTLGIPVGGGHENESLYMGAPVVSPRICRPLPA